MKNEGLKALLDMVGGILAFLAAFLFLAEAIIEQGWFEAPEVVGQVLAVVKQYGLIVLIGIRDFATVQEKKQILLFRCANTLKAFCSAPKLLQDIYKNYVKVLIDKMV